MAEDAGFCFGVKRAIDLAEKSVNEGNSQVFSLGPLIHNHQAVEKLSRAGIKVIENLSQADRGSIVIIRSHGVGPETYKAGTDLGLILVDATCPFVAKAQRIAQSMNSKGIQAILVGDEHHPEVIGIKGWTDDNLIVIKDAEDATTRLLPQRVGILAQTTQSKDIFDSVVNKIKEKCQEVVVYNSICNATKQRQEHTIELAGEVEVVIVVGGRDSANTGKLAALSRQQGTATYQIETADEINAEWLNEKKIIGITAGASTPQWIIQEVERKIKELDKMSNLGQENVDNEIGQEQEKVEVNEIEIDSNKGELTETMSETIEMKSFKTGEIVEGTVAQVDSDEILIYIGGKSEGVLPIRELSDFEISSPDNIVKIGDKIDVMVVRLEDSEGRLVLSKIKADAEKIWSALEEKLGNGQPVEGIVREAIKGGLLIDIGLKAFMPASLVDRSYVEDLSGFIDRTIMAKVIELDFEKKKVVLSRKSILEDEYSIKKEEMFNSLKDNMIVDGVVKRLTNFGAFVDIGGIDGLLHVSEMSWQRISLPADILAVNDKIKVIILGVDKDKEKISLGLKQLSASPWDNIEKRYKVGQVLEAEVVRIAPFGAFLRLEPGIEGLVHISHLSDSHVTKTEEIVKEGQRVNVKILSIELQEKRIRLSIKEAVSDEERGILEYNPQNKNNFNSEIVQEESNITIGDLVGDILKKLNK
ncbi:MAG: bifunctional 4-hydroxy-3-methylbut-2-enyl diphosphate reductase/30S ribosomal protein S1 [Peptococcaceae bacterium]|nr:bifunctional 4-hydroxy-3-methylbut-2-enyl diphosphate reductase/30S ribosomal protein S1 [Peptococcaceae bacterium]